MALWQGPDGKDDDETDFYELADGVTLNPDHNGDRYFQYRVTFSEPDGSCTPRLDDIFLTYTAY